MSLRSKGVYPQLLYRTHGSYSLVFENCLKSAVFAFFAPFVRHRFSNLTCTLNPPVFLIMEKFSPTVHLIVRCCIFCTTLTAFLILLGAIRHRIPIRGKRRQTLALLFKLVPDLVPVILGALNSSKRTSLDDGKSEACFRSGHRITG